MKVKTKTPLGLRIISLLTYLVMLGANVWSCVHVIYDMDCVNNPILLIVMDIILIIIFMITIIHDSIIYAIEDMNFE